MPEIHAVRELLADRDATIAELQQQCEDQAGVHAKAMAALRSQLDVALQQVPTLCQQVQEHAAEAQAARNEVSEVRTQLERQLDTQRKTLQDAFRVQLDEKQQELNAIPALKRKVDRVVRLAADIVALHARKREAIARLDLSSANRLRERINHQLGLLTDVEVFNGGGGGGSSGGSSGGSRSGRRATTGSVATARRTVAELIGKDVASRQ